MAPQKDMSMSQSLEPVNATLFETKIFTDKNKALELRSVILDCLVGCKSSDKYTYVTEEDTWRGGGNMTTEAKIGVMWQ